jgi:predicted nuclease with TOPRIM domain
MKTALIRIYQDDLRRVREAMDQRNKTTEAKLTLADSLHFCIERSARQSSQVAFYEIFISKLRKDINSLTEKCIQLNSASLK